MLAWHGSIVDPSSVVSRSNSDLLAIKMMADNTNMSSAARMEAIAEYAAKWYTDTRLHPSQNSIATEEYQRCKKNRRLFS